MTQATTLRRTYTNAHQNDDDSQSFDDSVMISSTSSSTSSASESETKTYASEKKSIENIVKNTTRFQVRSATRFKDSWNTWCGVLNPSLFLGRWFNRSSIILSSSSVTVDK